jgi:coenzyme F420-reducing hydrogenase beta subunit
MIPDEEGFSYPVINKNECISCGRCEKVCPFNREDNSDNTQKPTCYYGWLSDQDDRFRSTSGGAFYAIASHLVDQGIKHVYGASYSDDLQVVHIHVNEKNDLIKLRRSKYVQSDLNDVFAEITELLKTGEKVLFSGTPCQVQGLLNTTGEKYTNNLYTVSLVCHGVSSPLVFKRYLEELEKVENAGIKAITFRDKQIIDNKLTHKCTTVEFTNGKIIKSNENPYTMAFGIGIITRPSCFNCRFSTPYRNCDITIGDFWGIEAAIPELSSKVSDGISLILAHTEKGKIILEGLDSLFYIEKADLNWAINPRQQQLLHPMVKNSRRDAFMKSFVKGRPFIKKAKKEILIYKIRRSVGVRISRFKKLLTEGR